MIATRVDLVTSGHPTTYCRPGTWLGLVFAGLAVYAFVVSLGGQSVFKDSVLD